MTNNYAAFPAYGLLFFSLLSIALAETDAPSAADPLDVGSRRELFVDNYLIDKLDGAGLALNRPKDEGAVMRFDKPWEGLFCGYVTIIKDGGEYRMYYRGLPEAGRDGSDLEVTCVAFSKDGINWTKPELGIFEVGGSKQNNVVLAGAAPLSHNFCPFIDTRPDVPAAERYKALGGVKGNGLVPFASADGLRWKKLSEKGVITDGEFDSQNLAFWSESEGCYVAYFRTWANNARWVGRATSKDFLHWSPTQNMEIMRPNGPAPIEHLYTNQTGSYFRAPHIYVATAARFMPERRAISDAQAKEIGVHSGYYNDISDAVLLTSRSGLRYDRTFMEGFLRPGIGPHHWVSRTNYPALGVVQTGPDEMSFYVQNDYAQPSHCLRRHSVRLDGFASVRAPYDGGEMLTKPFTFEGKRLSLNFATSAAGGIKVEIQDADGRPLPGFTLADCKETIGNEIAKNVAWKGGEDVSSLAGKPIRLRFVMKDADLYSLKFEP